MNVTLNLTLVRIMGFGGLALGTGLAALVDATLLFIVLRKRLDGIEGRRIAVAFVKIFIASIVMALVAWGAEQWLSILWPGSRMVHRAVRVGLSVGAGVGTLVVMARLLRLEEFERALASVVEHS